MSLSKPFKPFKLKLLPKLALENVLTQMDPIELFMLGMCASLDKEIASLKLADYCDIECNAEDVELRIKMKSGRTLKVCVENEEKRYLEDGLVYPDTYRSDFVEMTCDDEDFAMEMYKFNEADTICYLAYVTKTLPIEDKKIRLFDVILLHFFPCRVRNFDMFWAPADWIYAEIFVWYELASECENLHLVSTRKTCHGTVLEHVKFSKKLTLQFSNRNSYQEELIDLTQVANVENLSLVNIDKMSKEQLFELNNEHLEVKRCSLNNDDLTEYIEKWKNGEFPKLKTISGCYWEELIMPIEPVDPIDGGPLRPREPCLVKLSPHIYIDSNPGIESDLYQSVIYRNNRGDFATLISMSRSFHFVVWPSPLPPVEVPHGHQLVKAHNLPFYIVQPLSPKVFDTDEEATLDSEGLISVNVIRWPFFTRFMGPFIL